jgi:hypothetical protein
MSITYKVSFIGYKQFFTNMLEQEFLVLEIKKIKMINKERIY